jgi:hypothetical protein
MIDLKHYKIYSTKATGNTKLIWWSECGLCKSVLFEFESWLCYLLAQANYLPFLSYFQHVQKVRIILLLGNLGKREGGRKGEVLFSAVLQHL